MVRHIAASTLLRRRIAVGLSANADLASGYMCCHPLGHGHLVTVYRHQAFMLGKFVSFPESCNRKHWASCMEIPPPYYDDDDDRDTRPALCFGTF